MKKILFLLFLTFSLSTWADDSGTTGDCTWTYDETDSTLTISGNGAMADYDYIRNYPWYEWSEKIKTVVIESGVSSIGSYAFCSIPMKSVILPVGLTVIKHYAFYGCPQLSEITLPEAITSIEDGAFENCSSLSLVISHVRSPYGFGSYVFQGISKECLLYVPSGSKAIYEGDTETRKYFSERIYEMEADMPVAGDVNEDGNVDINDVVAVINQMAGAAVWKNANVNGDVNGQVDINDVVTVINIMAGNFERAYSFAAPEYLFKLNPDEDEKGRKISIRVNRNTTVGAVTLPVTAVFSDSVLLSGPDSVSFEDGSNIAYYLIDINDALEYDKEYKVSLSIDTLSRETSSQFILSTSISIIKKTVWKSLGMATYREDCISSLYQVDCVSYKVPIEGCNIPGYYRLVNPYGEAYEYNEAGDWDRDNDYYLYVHAENPEAVWIDQSDTGCNWGSGNFVIWSMAGYQMAHSGYTLEDCKAQGLTGTLADGLITMPTKSVLLSRGGTPWYYANTNGLFAIALPGFTIPDYSAEVTYISSDADSVIADVTLGPSVDHAWITVVPGREKIEDAYNFIADGTITSADIADEASMKYVEVRQGGEIRIPMSRDAENGTYTIVVFTFGVDGKVVADYKDYNYTTFKFTRESGVEEKWTAMFKGNYKYCSAFYDEVEEELTLYGNATDEYRYKIKHWGVDIDLFFTLAKDGEITIEEQEIGETYGDYGSILICTKNKYWSGEDYNPETMRSYFDGGVFHFKVVYYVSVGYIGDGEETFTITGSAAKERDHMPVWSFNNIKKLLKLPHLERPNPLLFSE